MFCSCPGRARLWLTGACALLACVLLPTSAAVAAPPSSVTAAQNCVNYVPSPPAPGADPFYTAPVPLPAGAPGTVIRSRPVCLASYGIGVPYEAWQVMYLSTGTETTGGKPSYLHAAPTVDIATIIEPLTAAATTPRPLVSYQEAEDANSENSAPSYTMRSDPSDEELAWPPLLSQGIALVIPDHEGLHSEVASGVQAAHAVLDGIRAAESFAPAGLGGSAAAPTPVGLWGYSGGAIATGWAAELAGTYAPELHIVGVAEGGVPANVKVAGDNLNGGVGGDLALIGGLGLGDAYPNLLYDKHPNPGNGEVGGSSVTGWDTILNPAGQAVAAQLHAGTNNLPPFANVDNYTWCGCSPSDRPAEFPGVARMLSISRMGQPRHVPDAPMYIYQAYWDELIPFSQVQTLVNSYCSEGVNVDFHVDYATEHLSLADDWAPVAFAFLTSRFAGAPAPTTCGLPYHGGAPVDPPISTGGTLKDLAPAYAAVTGGPGVGSVSGGSRSGDRRP